MPRITAIRKAPSPMTGGRNWLPLEARHSMAPACSPVKPRRFMVGIVMLPDKTMLATACPVTMPISELATTAE